MADFLGSSTGLYFYSTVFQGNMALLALVRVFAIFKLQQIEKSLYENKQKIISILGHTSFNIETLYPDMDIDKLVEKYIKIASEPFNKEHPYTPNNERYMQIKRFIDSHENFLTQKGQRTYLAHTKILIIQGLKKTFDWTLIVIIFSLILLPLSVVIHNYSHFLEIYLIVALIVLNILALNQNRKVIYNLLNI